MRNSSSLKHILILVGLVCVYVVLCIMSYKNDMRKSLANNQIKTNDTNNSVTKEETNNTNTSVAKEETNDAEIIPIEGVPSAPQEVSPDVDLVSLQAKYAELAKTVRLEPEGATVSRYSDKDIDNPAIPGYFITDKIISEDLPIVDRGVTEISPKEKRLMTLIVYHETSSEPYEGKLAVANVILNKYYDKSDWFPDTIEGVLLQKNVYEACFYTEKWPKCTSDYDSGNFTDGNYLLAVRAVEDALSGKNNIGTRLFGTFYYKSKNEEHNNAVRIQNNLFWDK